MLDVAYGYFFRKQFFLSENEIYLEIYTVVYHQLSRSLTVMITINYDINPKPLPKDFNVMASTAFTPLA